MAKKSRRPQRSKRERQRGKISSSNAYRRFQKERRRERKDTSRGPRGGCLGWTCRCGGEFKRPSTDWRQDWDGWLDGWSHH